ncbi:hypothetical protein MKEN_00833900 [Mycena kentingensis (nom. inval.)]|nr:hypothetical protein MKEN_00833900 [Mycena kentingensis (nom. inval.)]
MPRKSKTPTKPAAARALAPSSWSKRTGTVQPVASPRNSFSDTDYYRKTKEEIHSPISWAATAVHYPLAIDADEWEGDAEEAGRQGYDAEDADDRGRESQGRNERGRVGALWLALVRRLQTTMGITWLGNPSTGQQHSIIIGLQEHASRVADKMCTIDASTNPATVYISSSGQADEYNNTDTFTVQFNDLTRDDFEVARILQKLSIQ